MVDIAQKHIDKLPTLKSNVEDAESSFASNKKRYEEDRKFLYKSTLTPDDESMLQEMGKPSIKINVIEAYVSRLIGEWSKQTPELQVKGTGNTNLAMQEDIVEGYLRSIFSGSDYEFLADQIYKETMSGGYSVMKVFTEYKNEESFDQVIRLKKSFSPKLCGFDPMARHPSKADGQYCYELIPKSKEEFEEEYPDINIEELSFYGKNVDGFNWTYNTQNNKNVLYICEYYEKKKIKEARVLISNIDDPTKPISVSKKEYDALIATWDSIEVPPVILKQKKVNKTKIMRYKFIGNKMIEKPEELDYSYLPLVFFDGNSVWLDEGQMTRSYIYNAKGPQRVKNFSISCLVDAMENQRQSTIMIQSEALPHKMEYLEAWTNPQKAKGALVYSGFDKENKPLSPPQYFQPGEINPIFLQVYNNENQTIQAVLGSYDAQQGVQTKDLSGKAIIEGATQSNNAAMPFVVNYLISLNQVAKIIVDLIPKYYKTSTTIPIITKKGDHDYITVNDGQPETDLIYNQNDLEVVVKPGVNFEVQKNRAVQVFIEMMKVSETFKAMVETEALPILLDNLDIKGQDKLKLIAEEFMQQMKQAKQQQAQAAAQQPDPALVLAQAEQKKADNEAQSIQMKNQVEQIRLEIEKMKVGIEATKAQGDLLLRQQQAEDKREKNAADIALKRTDQLIEVTQESL